MKRTDRSHRILYRVVSGNVVGVVEELETIRPGESLDAIRMVKIGVINATHPLDEDDAREVIKNLRAFMPASQSALSETAKRSKGCI